MRSRGKTSPTPVKQAALDAGLAVISPESVNKPEVWAQLEEAAPDVLVVIAFGQMIGKHLRETWPGKILNIHGSLLPRYRGAAPIQRALMNGDAKTGLSAMLIEKELDAGDVLATSETPILPEDDLETLYDRLSDMAALLLLETLRSYDELYAKRIPQDPALVTYAEKLTREDALLDFSRSTEELLNQTRTVKFWPGAKFHLEGDWYRVHAAHAEEGTGRALGSIVRADRSGLAIQAKDGLFVVDRIQAPNRKAMPVGDFLNGHPLSTTAQVTPLSELSDE